MKYKNYIVVVDWFSVKQPRGGHEEKYSNVVATPFHTQYDRTFSLLKNKFMLIFNDVFALEFSC